MGVPKIQPAMRDEIIRKWVRALPDERKAICRGYGISNTLPLYWRKQGFFPKDVTVPPEPKKAPAHVAPPAGGVVVPRDGAVTPYTIPERKIIFAEYEEARAQAAAGGADADGIHRAGSVVIQKYGHSIRSWLYKEDKFSSSIVPRRRIPDDMKRRLAAEYAAAPDKLATAERMGFARSELLRWGRDLGMPKAAASPRGDDAWRELVARVRADLGHGGTIVDVCKKHGLAPSSYYYQAKRLGGAGQPPKRGRAVQPDLVHAANGALRKLDHPTPMIKTRVGAVLREVVSRLHSEGIRITSLRTEPDGSACTVTYETTETIIL